MLLGPILALLVVYTRTTRT